MLDIMWRQMFADTTGRPFTRVQTQEPGALGVAMLAGVAVGCWRDLEEAVSACVRPDPVTEPDPVRHEAYGKILRLYQRLRADLSGECDEMGGTPAALRRG